MRGRRSARLFWFLTAELRIPLGGTDSREGWASPASRFEPNDCPCAQHGRRTSPTSSVNCLLCSAPRQSADRKRLDGQPHSGRLSGPPATVGATRGPCHADNPVDPVIRWVLVDGSPPVDPPVDPRLNDRRTLARARDRSPRRCHWKVPPEVCSIIGVAKRDGFKFVIDSDGHGERRREVFVCVAAS